MPRSLTLEQMHIAEPCHADWAAMTGDNRSRFCDSCQKHVHDISAGTRAEGEAMLAGMTGSICVRYATTAAGTVVTRDAPPTRWRAWPLLSMAVAFALTLVGCRRDDADADGPGRPDSGIYRTTGMLDMSTLHHRPATAPAASQPATTEPSHDTVGMLPLPTDDSDA